MNAVIVKWCKVTSNYVVTNVIKYFNGKNNLFKKKKWCSDKFNSWKRIQSLMSKIIDWTKYGKHCYFIENFDGSCLGSAISQTFIEAYTFKGFFSFSFSS